MNPNDRDSDSLPPRLRWQLRTLRREQPPARDLWDGIAARLPAQAPAAPAAAAPMRRRWRAPIALAATLLLALGFAGWWSQSVAPLEPTLVQREAAAMTRQYRAAMVELDAASPAATAPPARVQSTLDALDRDAALIADALARDPDSRRLLRQLRRTYGHRLSLGQRLVHG